MNSNSLHRQAMELADEADAVIAKAAGLFGRACGYEEQAAESCTDPVWKAVLYRSAATLALLAGMREDVQRLAECGLQCLPPDEIAAELREVMEQAKESE